MNSLNYLGFLIVNLVLMASTTIVNEGLPIPCVNANITQVRIKGCKAEPCTFRRGERVGIEIDFYFSAPTYTGSFDFRVTGPWRTEYYFKNGVEHVSYILSQSTECLELQLKDCPAFANVDYTLKTILYAQTSLMTEGGPQPFQDEGGSSGDTKWVLSALPLKDPGIWKELPENSLCQFTVGFYLAEIKSAKGKAKTIKEVDGIETNL